MVIVNPYLFVFFSMKWHSPEAIVNTILKTAICKGGISFWSSEHRKEKWCYSIFVNIYFPILTPLHKAVYSHKKWIIYKIFATKATILLSLELLGLKKHVLLKRRLILFFKAMTKFWLSTHLDKEVFNQIQA